MINNDNNIPTVWQQVLDTADDAELGRDNFVFQLYRKQHIHSSQNSIFDYLRELTPPMLVVGEEFSGDALVLNVNNMRSDGDCPVLLISHEHSEPSEWESINEFIEWLEADDE